MFLFAIFCCGFEFGFGLACVFGCGCGYGFFFLVCGLMVNSFFLFSSTVCLLNLLSIYSLGPFTLSCATFFMFFSYLSVFFFFCFSPLPPSYRFLRFCFRPFGRSNPP